MTPRPKEYESSADRSRAWRQRRAEELRTTLASRLREADDQTLERLTNIIPMPGLMRLHRALDIAQDPEAAHEHPHRHEHGPHHRHHRMGPAARRARRHQCKHDGSQREHEPEHRHEHE